MSPILLPLIAVFAALPQGPSDAERAAREAEFEKLVSGSKLVGRFTTRGSDRPAQEESYTITKVTKLRDDNWRFDAIIEYGGRSGTVPIVVQVRWAGGTPMIQVTNLTIPFMGTYSARVLIYRGEYAGTWSGGDYGGQMFGRVVPAEVKDGENGTGQEAADASWGDWRGPLGNGTASSGNPPTQWNEEDGENIRWKVPVPGLGSSSPVVWGDRLYYTTAIQTDRQGEAPAAQPQQERRGRRRGGRGGRGEPLRVHEFVVFALDRKDGSTLWRTTVAEEVPHERGQQNNSQASYSPITDGERIYAFFGSRGLHCLDLNGDVLWSKEFGLMQTFNGFGEGSSPALHGEVLVVNWDHQGDSFIAALDKRTGDELWRTPREEITSWSTPRIVPVDGRHQVIVTATSATRSYDLETGELVWSLRGMTRNSIPSSNYADGVIYLMSGYRGNMLQAVRLAGARGDLEGSDNVLWEHGRNTSYVPSSLLYGDLIYFLSQNSPILTCLDANTGDVQYERQRIAGLREVYSSPVGVNGRIYITSRDGITKVIKLGSTYEEIATNQLNDGFDASAAIVGDEIYLRGREFLYCIAER